MNTLLLKTDNSIHLQREFCMVGKSQAMQELFQMIDLVSNANSTVLILGESGTGKELVAKAVHVNSPRADCSFVSVNCGAFPETLLESELFGHVRGAFTGATDNKRGLFEVADKGTLFLDEIGDTSMAMQVKLLRVLQGRTIRRVGGTDEIPIDIRVVAATHKDLPEMVAEKQFREDLFYRISVIPLTIPPLRHRKEDIPRLADYFLGRLNTTMGKDIASLSGEAVRRLESYDWPGNVRELENAMERAYVLETSRELSAQHLPDRASVTLKQRSVNVTSGGLMIPEEGFDLERYVENLKKAYLEEALNRTNGIQIKAAELLRMSYRSFRHYMEKYGVDLGRRSWLEGGCR